MPFLVTLEMNFHVCRVSAVRTRTGVSGKLNSHEGFRGTKSRHRMRMRKRGTESRHQGPKALFGDTGNELSCL